MLENILVLFNWMHKMLIWQLFSIVLQILIVHIQCYFMDTQL